MSYTGKWRRSRTCFIAASLGLAILLGFLSGISVGAQEDETTSKDHKSFWKSEIKDNSGSILHLCESLSGKKCSRRTRDLLCGVNRITRDGDRIAFHRVDGESVVFGRGSEFGDHLNDEIEDVSVKAEKVLGPNGRLFMSNLSEISLRDKEVFVDYGSESMNFDLSAVSRKSLKELRVARLSAKIDTRKGTTTLKSIEGIVVVVNIAGFDCPIELKEFSRRKQKNGDTLVTFGVRNPVPVLGALFFKVIPVSFTIKKKTDFKKPTNWRKDDARGHKWRAESADQ